MDKGNSDTSSSESGELDMYQILIVDDEERVRDLLAKNISKLPLEVEVAAVASDGREALELAIQLKPDIVITDIAMPFLNGLELIRKMRENGIESKNLIISGYDEFDYARQAIALGVQNYLLKPFLPKDIKNELEKIIRELDSQRVLLQNMEMLENLAQSRNAIMQETVLKDILEGSQEKMDLWKDSGIKTDASWYVAGILKLEQSKWDFVNQNKVEEFLEMIRDQYFSSELSMYAVSFDKKSLAVFWSANGTHADIAQRRIVEGLTHIQQSLKKYYQIRLTGALGSPYRTLNEVYQSYREAQSVWRGMVDVCDKIKIYQKEEKKQNIESETKNQIRFWKNQIRLCVRTGQQQEALSNLTGLIKSYAALADKKNDYIYWISSKKISYAKFKNDEITDVDVLENTGTSVNVVYIPDKEELVYINDAAQLVKAEKGKKTFIADSLRDGSLSLIKNTDEMLTYIADGRQHYIKNTSSKPVEICEAENMVNTSNTSLYKKRLYFYAKDGQLYSCNLKGRAQNQIGSVERFFVGNKGK